MYMRVVTQPAVSCRLSQPHRTRADNGDNFLAGDSNQSVQVAVCLSPGEPTPTGELTLLATIVTYDGENHPYSLQGPSCDRGVFSYTFKFRPNERESCISLDRVLVMSCPQAKWVSAMEAKRETLGIELPVRPYRLKPHTVKTIRISFRMVGVSSIVTREIQCISQTTSSGARPAPAAAGIPVIDVLPTELYYAGNFQVAILLGNSISDDTEICKVVCTAECTRTNKTLLPFDCQVVKHIKHLVIVQLPLLEELKEIVTKNNSCECQLKVVMVNGGVEKTAESMRIALKAFCDSCFPCGHSAQVYRKQPADSQARSACDTAAAQQLQIQQLQLLQQPGQLHLLQSMQLLPPQPLSTSALSFQSLFDSPEILAQLLDPQLATASAVPAPTPQLQAVESSTRQSRLSLEFHEAQFYPTSESASQSNEVYQSEAQLLSNEELWSDMLDIIKSAGQ